MKQIKQTYLVLLIVISLFSLAIYSTYAMFTTEINTNNIVSINTTLSIDTNIDEYQMLTIDSNSYKILELSINNSQEENLYYGVWYELISGNNYNIEVYKLDTSLSSTVDIIKTAEQKKVAIVLINNTNKKAVIKIGIETSKNSSLNLYEERKLITSEINIENIKNQTAAEYLKSIYTEENKELYYNSEDLLYYGENPNNYIILNEELWQIIGVYKNNLKLIKTESIGKYTYDNQNNNFENSQIIKFLNEYYFNSENNGEYDFTKSWIKEKTLDYLDIQTIENEIIMVTDIENINKISIMTETNFQSNITLLSLKDYQKVLNCEETECKDSWINKRDTLLSTQNEVENNIKVLSITEGKIKIDNTMEDNIEIRPVVLLREDITIIKGNGSEENPYVLK